MKKLPAPEREHEERGAKQRGRPAFADANDLVNPRLTLSARASGRRISVGTDGRRSGARTPGRCQNRRPVGTDGRRSEAGRSRRRHHRRAVRSDRRRSGTRRSRRRQHRGSIGTDRQRCRSGGTWRREDELSVRTHRWNHAGGCGREAIGPDRILSGRRLRGYRARQVARRHRRVDTGGARFSIS